MNLPSDIVPQFVSAAREYRLIIDQATVRSPHQFLVLVQTALARLYSLALLLPDADPTTDVEPPDGMSHDEWHQLYERLAGHLGSSDLYWMVFDPIDPDDHDSNPHTLADDLSDIYRDLARATVEAQRELSADALWSLRFSFETHWGHHAVNALAAIHSGRNRYLTSRSLGEMALVGLSAGTSQRRAPCSRRCSAAMWNAQ